jgi:hypothetical protein
MMEKKCCEGFVYELRPLYRGWQQFHSVCISNPKKLEIGFSAICGECIKARLESMNRSIKIKRFIFEDIFLF